MAPATTAEQQLMDMVREYGDMREAEGRLYANIQRYVEAYAIVQHSASSQGVEVAVPLAPPLDLSVRNPLFASPPPHVSAPPVPAPPPPPVRTKPRRPVKPRVNLPDVGSGMRAVYDYIASQGGVVRRELLLDAVQQNHVVEKHQLANWLSSLRKTGLLEPLNDQDRGRVALAHFPIPPVLPTSQNGDHAHGV